MNVTRSERVLFVIAAIAVIYRIVLEQWPISVEVED